MGKRKRAGAEASPTPSLPWEGWALAALWAAAFLALTVVGDQKILRYKLLAAEAGAAAALAWVFAAWAARAPALWTRTPLDVPVALYGAGALFFYALSPERGASGGELSRMLLCAAAFFAAAQSARRLARPDAPAAAWALGGAAAGAYALLQTRGGLGPIAVPLVERPIFTFGNSIFLAAFLASSACVAGALAWTRRRGPWASCAALALAGLWTTQSRAAILGLAAAAGLAGLLRLEGKRRLQVLAGLVVAAMLLYFHFRGRAWTHGLIWQDTLSLWLSNPWLGCGLGRFHIEFPAHASEALRALWPQSKVIVNFAHNEYLQVLAETGVAGFALLAAVAGGWLGMFREWAQREDLPHRALVGGLLLAAGTIFAQNVFSPDLRFGVSSFLLFSALGFAAALGWGSSVPLPEFPGRFALAGVGLLSLVSWGRLAAGPYLAQRRLAAQPAFHVAEGSEFERAVSDLEARLREAPDADAAENLAFLYAKSKRWQDAARYFELTARLAPERPGPFNNLGNIAYSTGDREKAILWWGKSLEIGPDQLDARLNLGKTLYEMGRLKESAANLEEVLRRDPKNEKAQVLLRKMIE